MAMAWWYKEQEFSLDRSHPKEFSVILYPLLLAAWGELYLPLFPLILKINLQMWFFVPYLTNSTVTAEYALFYLKYFSEMCLFQLKGLKHVLFLSAGSDLFSRLCYRMWHVRICSSILSYNLFSINISVSMYRQSIGIHGEHCHILLSTNLVRANAWKNLIFYAKKTTH